MNELKTILVHVDAAPNIAQRLELAQRLAQMHRARVEVLYAVLPAVLRDLAERAKAKGVKEVIFDRGGYRFHGRVKALADAAREGGLSF